MYKGSCLCGAIHYTLNGAISDIIHCHCSLCRKSTGSAYATNGFIAASDLHLSDADNKLTFYESEPGKRKYFCQVCASPIYSANAKYPGRYRLRIGSLDSDIIERPLSHNFITSKANWDDPDAELPRYAAFEPSRK